MEEKIISNKQQVRNIHLEKRKVLYQEGEIILSREIEFSDEVIRFLDSTTWGTKDTLYEHKKTEKRIRDLSDPIPILLRSGDDIVATVLLDRRMLTNKGFKCISYFFRYLASNVNFRGRHIVGKYGRKCMDIIRDGQMDKAIYFACIEAKNYRSYNFVKKIGYKEVAKVKTLGFSRFFPRKDKRLNRVTDSFQKERVLDLLKGKYVDFSLVHFSNIFKNGGYFTIEEDGEIIAGVQAHPATWVIKKLSTKLEKVLFNVVPYIPVLNRIFNPNKFEFLAFEGIYYLAGREKDLLRLFEGVLNHYRRKSALFWLDENDPMFKDITTFGHLGLIDQFVNTSDTWIMASCRNMEKEEEKQIYDGPVYVSSFDFI